MKYTKDEEARAERSSVKMWPGITAGIIIGLIAFVLSFDACVSCSWHAASTVPELGWPGVRGRHDPPVHLGHVGIQEGPHPRQRLSVGRTRTVQQLLHRRQRPACDAQHRIPPAGMGAAGHHEHSPGRTPVRDPFDRHHRGRPSRQDQHRPSRRLDRHGRH